MLLLRFLCVFLIPRQSFLLHTDHLRAFCTQLLRAPITENAMIRMSLSGQSSKSGTSNTWLLRCFVLFVLFVNPQSLTQNAVQKTTIYSDCQITQFRSVQRNYTVIFSFSQEKLPLLNKCSTRTLTHFRNFSNSRPDQLISE